MSRDLTVDMQNALQATIVRPLFFVELEFISATVRLASSNRDWSWNAQTWLANSKILVLNDTLKETVDQRADGAVIVLGGADSDMLSFVLSGSQQDKKGRIYLGLIADDDTLIDDPIQVFEGNFDKAEIRDDGSQSSIEISYENAFIVLSRTKELRYTKYCQESLFAGDLGFDYAPAAEDWSGFWGKPARPQFQRKRKSGRR